MIALSCGLRANFPQQGGVTKADTYRTEIIRKKKVSILKFTREICVSSINCIKKTLPTVVHSAFHRKKI